MCLIHCILNLQKYKRLQLSFRKSSIDIALDIRHQTTYNNKILIKYCWKTEGT